MLSGPVAGDDYDGRDHRLECKRCMNAVQASSQQQWLVSRSCWFLADGHVGQCGVVEGQGALVMVILLHPLAGLQVLVDSCILGCVGGK